MTPQDVIAHALRTTPVPGWEPDPNTLHGTGGHQYYIGCALCGGEIDTLTTAIINNLADAGYALTAEADGSEHPATPHSARPPNTQNSPDGPGPAPTTSAHAHTTSRPEPGEGRLPVRVRRPRPPLPLRTQVPRTPTHARTHHPTQGANVTRVLVTRTVTKRCPYVDEIDVGTVALTFHGNAPELHALAAELNAYRTVATTHEDFTRHLYDLPGVIHVTTTWHTAGFDVVVTYPSETT